jgi:hypothetical protein
VVVIYVVTENKSCCSGGVCKKSRKKTENLKNLPSNKKKERKLGENEKRRIDKTKI